MKRSIASLRHDLQIVVAMFVVIISVTPCGAQSAAQSAPAGKPAAEAFLARDTNGDGVLSEEEFVAGGGQQKAALVRDFKVFDANRDGRLNETEFLSVPAFTAEDQRSAIPDPVIIAAAEKKAELTKHWSEWDRDGDGMLTADEFQGSMMARRIRGLETTRFDDWDSNKDGKISKDEMSLLLDIAFGVRIATGELLRAPSGRVIDFRMFRGLNPDQNWTVARADYIKLLGSIEKAEQWFPKINALGKERFSLTEFATSGHRTDPVAQFLSMDNDLNGQLSPEELKNLPAGWGPPGRAWLTGFDDDRDGAYSLREFSLIPHVNLLVVWGSAHDANDDGKLDPDEFHFVPGPALAALTAEYFRRLDTNQDQSLSIDEWPFRTSNPDVRFRLLDSNSDGELSDAEFVAEGSLPVNRLRRDFKVFDADGNGRMTRAEFLTIPHWVREDLRLPISDPVVMLSQASTFDLEQNWVKWDVDNDGSLDAKEFKVAAIGNRIRGLEATGINDWDLNHDGKVSREEASRILDVAYGVCVVTGERLRSKEGRVVDWRSFRNMDSDGDGRITRKEFLRMLGALPNAEQMYRNISKDDADSFGVAEFALGPNRTDPVGMFLQMDADLNGQLTREELVGIPPDWGPPTKIWLSTFDDNGDGAYSLREFMLIPHVNLLTTWHSARDLNQDGKLSVEEFRFAPLPALAALSAEYFVRLDLNRDNSLSLNEWPFQTNHPDAKFVALDTDADGDLTESEFVAEGSLPADRLRRDFRLFDMDHNGRMSRTEFLSIPHWVPENMRSVIPDPVTLLSEASFSELTRNWSEWDKDRDGFLTQDEFKNAAIGRRVRGLEMTGFHEWDWDRDNKVSKEDVGRTLDIAYGVRSPTGEFLRSKAGHIVDWRSFVGLKPDSNGKVAREAYIKLAGSPKKAVEWFAKINDPGNEMFGVTEFATSNHRVDCILQFLVLDVDLNGQLSAAEMEALPAWGPPGRNWLPGFDDDGNGSYSLQEFRLIPQVNLLTTWHVAQDADHDGKLSPQEFHFMPTPSLAALSMVYFQRLDTNKDGYLQHKEWPCSLDLARVPRDVVIELRDRNGDGRLSLEEVMGELRRPEPGDRANIAQEAALVRFEEAFLRADTNDDGLLDLQELSTDEGLEAIAPGSSGLGKKANDRVAAPISHFFGLENATVETYAILEINVLLVIAVGIYLYRKKGQTK